VATWGLERFTNTQEDTMPDTTIYQPRVTSFSDPAGRARYAWACVCARRSGPNGFMRSDLCELALRDHLQECDTITAARENLADALAEAISTAVQAGVPVSLIQTDINAVLSLHSDTEES
jgi:hypothetical protein